MYQTHQEVNATRQRAAIGLAVRSALDAIRADIDAFGFYPHNRGRISQAEVLRRAGRIDKKTLRAPYHAELRQLISGFVLSHKRAKDKSLNRREQYPEADSQKAGGYDLAQLAQALVAAQILRDEAIEKLDQFLLAKDPPPEPIQSTNDRLF